MGRKAYLVRLLVAAAMVSSTTGPAMAQTFSSGSTGADGAFSPTSNTTLMLPANGVFNFTTVNIPAGVTVTFQKNASNTPVTMLATGDVIIAGTIQLNGTPGGNGVAGTLTTTNEGKAGPGGFDGGAGANGLLGSTGGKGLGPGGGSGGVPEPIGGNRCSGGGGGYASQGGTGRGVANCPNFVPGGPTYGSPALLPLIGGSGGGGGAGTSNDTGGGGGGGGGAIVVASSTKIVLTGSILARGGNGGTNAPGNIPSNFGAGGGGSGGAVRLVANTLEGSGGSVSVAGGDDGFGSGFQGFGGVGRIRLEPFDSTLVASFSSGPSIAKPTSVFLTNNPGLQITSIAGIAPPATPTGNPDTPDVILPATTTNPVTVNISASQIPVGTAVSLSVIPVNGAPGTVTTPGLSGSVASSSTSANVTIPAGQPSVLSATATFTVIASAGEPPILVAGEVVKAIKVAATYGGGSTVTYITASGKEVRVQ